MSDSYLVYVHTTPVNKKYVGITSNKPYVRWKYGYGYENQIFYAAIKQYGWDNIEHEIVATDLTKEEAEEMEKSLIAELHTNDYRYGYNLTFGGFGSFGRVCSDVTKLKISIANTGKKRTDEVRAQMSEQRKGKCYKCNVGENNPMYGRRGENNPNFGRHHSEETIKKMRGQTRSEETRKKMREAWVQRKLKKTNSIRLFDGE